MDKFFNSPWFVRIISFFIALMLFVMVNMDNLTAQPGVLPSMSPKTYTLEDVELKVYYDDERHAITDKTQHVQVSLRGSQTAITKFQVMRPSYEVYVDVTDKEEGVHTLIVQHRDFPSDLSVTVVPQYARVELEEKQTASFPVQVDTINAGQIEQGYSVGTPVVSPLNVEVTAARSLLAEVSKAKAFVDVSGADRMIEDMVPIKLYDENDRELFLSVEPSVAQVRVPITSPNRDVPTMVLRKGEMPEGLSVQEVLIEPDEVTVYGPDDVIDKMNVIEVGTIDLSKITETQTIEMTIRTPPGVERVSPEVVNVTVTVAEEQEKELAGVPIDVIGTREGEMVTFDGARTKLVTLQANGSEGMLERVTLETIQAFIDVSDLPVGDHKVDIQVNGPPNIEFNLDDKEISITIIAQGE